MSLDKEENKRNYVGKNKIAGNSVVDPDPACHFDADAYPTFHFNAVPDPDPDSSFQINIQNLEKMLK